MDDADLLQRLSAFEAPENQPLTPELFVDLARSVALGDNDPSRRSELLAIAVEYDRRHVPTGTEQGAAEQVAGLWAKLDVVLGTLETSGSTIFKREGWLWERGMERHRKGGSAISRALGKRLAGDQ